jgi:uncharacterized protein (TIGR02231 family)
VEGTGKATILDVGVKTTYTRVAETATTTQRDEIKALEAEVAARARAVAVIQAELERVKRQQAFLDKYAASVAASPGSAPRPGGTSGVAGEAVSAETVAGVAAFLAFFGTELARADASQFEVQAKLDEAHKALRAAQSELAQRTQRAAPAGGVHGTTSVAITLDAPAAASDLVLSLSYVTMQVAWTPRYDLRVYSQEEQLKVHYHGEVQQSTGEDWTNVRLALSTAQPSVGGQAPTPARWRLSVQPRYTAMRKTRGMGGAGGEVAMAFSMAPRMMARPMAASNAREAEGTARRRGGWA